MTRPIDRLGRTLRMDWRRRFPSAEPADVEILTESSRRYVEAVLDERETPPHPGPEVLAALARCQAMR